RSASCGPAASGAKCTVTEPTLPAGSVSGSPSTANASLAPPPPSTSRLALDTESGACPDEETCSVRLTREPSATGPKNTEFGRTSIAAWVARVFSPPQPHATDSAMSTPSSRPRLGPDPKLVTVRSSPGGPHTPGCGPGQQHADRRRRYPGLPRKPVDDGR